MPDSVDSPAPESTTTSPSAISRLSSSTPSAGTVSSRAVDAALTRPWSLAGRPRAGTRSPAHRPAQRPVAAERAEHPVHVAEHALAGVGGHRHGGGPPSLESSSTRTVYRRRRT